MLSDSEPLFRVNFDESVFRKLFAAIDDHLKLHDRQIAELMKNMSNFATKDDLAKTKSEIGQEQDDKMKQLSDSLEKKIDDDLKKANDMISDELKKANDQIADKVQQMQDQIEKNVADKIIDQMNNPESELGANIMNKINDAQKGNETAENEQTGSDVKSEVENLKELVNQLKNQNDENRQFIQTIASAYAAVNKTEAELDPSLQRTLNTTSETIARNFKRIFDALKFQNQASSSGRLSPSESGESGAGTAARGRGANAQQAQFAGPGRLDGPYPAEINLADLNFVGSEIPADFNEVPQLPQIYKFDTLPESVQYLYDSFPKLQGYLKAMHDKLEDVANNQDRMRASSGSSFDPSAYDNLVNSVRKALNDMSADLDELRRSKRGLSKADVMDIIRSMINQHQAMEPEETSVGYVKCIACGRDIRQVTGAMTEEQATRTLGAPPNSIVVNHDKSYGQVYGNSEQVDRSFLDSPRSIRPPQKKNSLRSPR